MGAMRVEGGRYDDVVARSDTFSEFSMGMSLVGGAFSRFDCADILVIGP